MEMSNTYLWTKFETRNDFQILCESLAWRARVYTEDDKALAMVSGTDILGESETDRIQGRLAGGLADKVHPLMQSFLQHNELAIV